MRDGASTAKRLRGAPCCSVFAELERGIIRERIFAGLARARSQGKALGRKPVSSKTVDRIRELRGKGLGKLKIARELGWGVSTVQRVLSEAARAMGRN